VSWSWISWTTRLLHGLLPSCTTAHSSSKLRTACICYCHITHIMSFHTTHIMSFRSWSYCVLSHQQAYHSIAQLASAGISQHASTRISQRLRSTSVLISNDSVQFVCVQDCPYYQRIRDSPTFATPTAMPSPNRFAPRDPTPTARHPSVCTEQYAGAPVCRCPGPCTCFRSYHCKVVSSDVTQYHTYYGDMYTHGFAMHAFADPWCVHLGPAQHSSSPQVLIVLPTPEVLAASPIQTTRPLLRVNARASPRSRTSCQRIRIRNGVCLRSKLRIPRPVPLSAPIPPQGQCHHPPPLPPEASHPAHRFTLT